MVSVRKTAGGTARFSGAGPLPDPASGIVVGAVARTEPSAKLASGIPDRNTAEMRAHAHHHKPFPCFIQGPVLIRRDGVVRQVAIASLLVAKFIQRHQPRFRDLLGSPPTNEHRFAAPLHGDLHTGCHICDIDIDRGQRPDRGVRIHLVDERPDGRDRGHRANRSCRDVEEVPPLGLSGRIAFAHFSSRSLPEPHAEPAAP